jgi:hypothetical protein
MRFIEPAGRCGHKNCSVKVIKAWAYTIVAWLSRDHGDY